MPLPQCARVIRQSEAMPPSAPAGGGPALFGRATTPQPVINRMTTKRLHLQGNFSLLGPLRHFVTFTMADVPDHITDYRKAWNRLLTYLRRHTPEWAGVRVHELFPGQWGWCSHGIHTHVVCNDAISEKRMRFIARAAGFGRMSFKTIESGSEEHAARYLAKYLGKLRPECLKGWQLVRSFGIIDAVRLVDIEKTSALVEAWAYGKTLPRWKGLSFYGKSMLAQEILWGMRLGRIPCESFVSLSGFPLYEPF